MSRAQKKENEARSPLIEKEMTSYERVIAVIKRVIAVIKRVIAVIKRVIVVIKRVIAVIIVTKLGAIAINRKGNDFL